MILSPRNTEASGNLTEVNEFLVGVVDTVDIEIIYRNIGPENAVGTTLTFTPTGVANEIITGAKIVDLNNVSVYYPCMHVQSDRFRQSVSHSVQ